MPSLLSVWIFCAGVLASAGAASAKLPTVIPHPQSMRQVSAAQIRLSDSGTTALRIVGVPDTGLVREAAALLESLLHKHAITRTASGPTTQIVLQTAGSGGLELTPSESAALARSSQSYLLRTISGDPAKVSIVGASPQGVYYGAATLVQLARLTAPGRLVLPDVDILDYPDTPRRMCADWVLTWDWEVNGYDWGDGLRAFMDRCRQKIDLCARYKVNRVRFLGGRVAPGPAYMQERYPRILQFARELNRYARSKGVALQYASTSFGIDHYNWGLPFPEPWILNREEYPDGRVYACVGGAAGGCLSNVALIDRIAARQKQFVRDIEPASLYLHNIDIAEYARLAAAWKERCPRCRERFPDDEPFSPHGYAAAVAGLYNRLTAELKSVRSATSGYDASRDLEIIFASPGYSYWPESDEDWEKDLKYFAEIARQVVDRQHVQMTFREQFNRLDGRGLRTPEMATRLEQAGWPGAMFMFAVQGADFLDSPRLFTSSPVLSGIYQGAGTLYNFNGHVFSEVQVLANANYAWNHHAPGAVDPCSFAGALLREEVSQYSSGRKHSEHLYGLFLDKACAALYGENAGPLMADVFRLERDQGPVVPLVAWLDRQWNDPSCDWAAQARRNRQARERVDNAVAVCDEAVRPELTRLSQCLEVCARICMLCEAVHREKAGRERVERQATELLNWLENSFKFERTEPDGGDPGFWKKVIAKVSGQAKP